MKRRDYFEIVKPREWRRVGIKGKCNGRALTQNMTKIPDSQIAKSIREPLMDAREWSNHGIRWLYVLEMVVPWTKIDGILKAL